MLAMMNVAAIASVRNWPTIAEYGFSSLFFFLIATLVFFIPTSLVSAELATAWPKTGGVFIWVKEAFGHRLGFLAIWLLWIENVIWYPTLLSFIAGTAAYMISPALASNPWFLVTTMLLVFWGVTLLNLLGMWTSGWISTVGAIAGTLIPGIVIITLGCAWIFQGSPLHITFSFDHFIPDLSHPQQLVFFVGVLLSFCGMEMSAIHARSVKNPQKDYPKAIWISALIILVLSILGVLAIASVIPQKEINLTAGVIQALTTFLSAYQLQSILPWIALLIAIGAIGSLNTWVIGPSRGLLAAAESGDLPPFFRKHNKKEMPVTLLITQALIVTFLSLLFVWMPSINSAYWILTVLVTQIYLVMYLLMFAAAIKLRYKKPNVERPYKIPGGNFGMWVTGLLGMASSLLALVIGFFPPAQIAAGTILFYVGFLLTGLILVCIAPSLILHFKTKKWDEPLAHERKGQ